MLPIRWQRRTGKEVPPERARTYRQKRNDPLVAELPEKNAETYLRQHGTLCSGVVLKTMPMARGGTMKRGEFCPSHHIDRKKAQVTRS